MAVSVREQSIAAAVERLGAMPGARCFRGMVDQIEQADLPCYDVEPGEWRIETPGKFGDHASQTLTLPLVVRYVIDAGATEGTDGSTKPIDDSALDPGYVWAVEQIVGADGNMGGVVYEALEDGGATVFRPGGKAMIGLEMHFQLIVGLKRGDPTTRG